MASSKQVSASATVAALGIIVPLVGDKVMDAIIAIFSENGLNKNEMLPLLGWLAFISITVWILQSGIEKLISKFLRKLRRTDEVDELRQKINTVREGILLNLEEFKSREQQFDQKVDSAATKVRTLSAKDENFSSYKEQAATTVVSLKTDYARNIKTLEESIKKLYRSIGEADKIFAGIEDWADKAGSQYFKKPPNH
jgi:outer membrane murein-binding lipoprotein Lpp